MNWKPQLLLEFYRDDRAAQTRQPMMAKIVADRYLAMELFYALEEGDLNFADVARQYIADPELNRRGGYLGTINRTHLRPEISAAVFAAKPPQLIEPVITPIGVHLIYVDRIIAPQLDNLYRQILMQMFDLWLTQQIAATEIDG